MKNKFKNLKIRLLLEVFKNAVFAVACGFFVWFLVQTVFRTPILMFIEWFGMDVLGMTRDWMQVWYDRIFRSNQTLIFGAILAVLLLFFLYRAFSRVTRYLSEIGDAVDVLVAQDAQKITLPEELKPLQERLSSAKDIIARREAQAREAEQRKNDLVVYLAHDLKTPLTSVIGYLTLLHDARETPAAQPLTPEQTAKFTGIALQKAQRLEELLNEFFEITRYNVQEIVLVCQAFNFGRMLEQIADELSPLLREKDLSISLTLDADLRVSGDADKLARVFDNLLKNAAVYAFRGSEIAVTAAHEADEVRATVSNRGICIPPTALTSIFEKFYRVDTARGTKTGSAGLGLAISKEIVLAHGGSISAESDETETKFTVLFPLSSVKSQHSFSE